MHCSGPLVLPPNQWDLFSNLYAVQAGQSLWGFPSGEAGHDLLIWIMQTCYSDLNPPDKNIKGQIKYPENMESERDALTEKAIIILLYHGKRLITGNSW